MRQARRPQATSEGAYPHHTPRIRAPRNPAATVAFARVRAAFMTAQHSAGRLCTGSFRWQANDPHPRGFTPNPCPRPRSPTGPRPFKARPPIDAARFARLLRRHAANFAQVLGGDRRERRGYAVPRAAGAGAEAPASTSAGRGIGGLVDTQIPTRMGDGALVRMTRADLEREVDEGVAAAVRRAKVPPLGADEIAHLVDIFASPQPLQRRRHRRRGHAQLRRLRQPGHGHARQRSAVLRAVPLRRLRRALSPRLLVQARQDGASTTSRR